jgi:superfamily II DNA or RNA helicase
LARLKSGATQVLIGSTILDVGVDVPAVGMVILAGGGKAEVGTRQRIGRGLRAKQSAPNVCFVVDFADDANRTLMEHALTRRTILTTTPGFCENILPEGTDFDYTAFR